MIVNQYLLDARELWCFAHPYVANLSEYGITLTPFVDAALSVMNQLMSDFNIRGKDDLIGEYSWTALQNIITHTTAILPSGTIDEIDSIVYETVETVLNLLELKLQPLLWSTRDYQLKFTLEVLTDVDLLIRLEVIGVV